MSTNLNLDNLDEESVLSELVREGGDPHVERSVRQIASVELAILARLQPPRLSERKHSSSIWTSRTKQMLALAAVVVLVIWLGRIWADFGVRQAWAQVAETMRGQPWIHGVCQGRTTLRWRFGCHRLK